MDIKSWIILILCFFCIIFAISSNRRYNKLDLEFQQYKYENTHVENDYIQENERLQQEIELLQEDLDICYFKLDSLKHLKQDIDVEYVVSNNIVSGADLLRENLECERFYR